MYINKIHMKCISDSEMKKNNKNMNSTFRIFHLSLLQKAGLFYIMVGLYGSNSCILHQIFMFSIKVKLAAG